MIKIILHKAIKDYKVRNFTIEKGQPILKIIFDDTDIHISRSGKKHLDIWGLKLAQVIRAINDL